MNSTQILSSTFFLTLLLMLGLFFFIRGSVKERTQKVTLMAGGPEETLLSQLKTYFEQRAYQVAAVDPAQNQVTFQGFVRPSWFLAIFLSILAAIGLLCLSMVLFLLYPAFTPWFLGMTSLAPLAGVFYWKKAGRVEQVLLKVESLPQSESQQCSLITVTAHRDELIKLRQAIPLQPIAEASK